MAQSRKALLRIEPHHEPCLFRIAIPGVRAMVAAHQRAATIIIEGDVASDGRVELFGNVRRINVHQIWIIRSDSGDFLSNVIRLKAPI